MHWLSQGGGIVTIISPTSLFIKNCGNPHRDTSIISNSNQQGCESFEPLSQRAGMAEVKQQRPPLIINSDIDPGNYAMMEGGPISPESLMIA